MLLQVHRSTILHRRWCIYYHRSTYRSDVPPICTNVPIFLTKRGPISTNDLPTGRTFLQFVPTADLQPGRWKAGSGSASQEFSWRLRTV